MYIEAVTEVFSITASDKKELYVLSIGGQGSLPGATVNFRLI